MSSIAERIAALKLNGEAQQRPSGSSSRGTAAKSGSQEARRKKGSVADRIAALQKANSGDNDKPTSSGGPPPPRKNTPSLTRADSIKDRIQQLRRNSATSDPQSPTQFSTTSKAEDPEGDVTGSDNVPRVSGDFWKLVSTDASKAASPSQVKTASPSESRDAAASEVPSSAAPTVTSASAKVEKSGSSANASGSAAATGPVSIKDRLRMLQNASSGAGKKPSAAPGGVQVGTKLPGLALKGAASSSVSQTTKEADSPKLATSLPESSAPAEDPIETKAVSSVASVAPMAEKAEQAPEKSAASVDTMSAQGGVAALKVKLAAQQAKPATSAAPTAKEAEETPEKSAATSITLNSEGGVAALKAELAGQQAKPQATTEEKGSTSAASASGGGGGGIAALKAKLASQQAKSQATTEEKSSTSAASPSGGGGGGIAALKAKLGGVGGAGPPIPGMAPRGFALPGLGIPMPGAPHPRYSQSKDAREESARPQSVDLTHMTLERASVTSNKRMSMRRGKRSSRPASMSRYTAADLQSLVAPIESPSAEAKRAKTDDAATTDENAEGNPGDEAKLDESKTEMQDG